MKVSQFSLTVCLAFTTQAWAPFVSATPEVSCSTRETALEYISLPIPGSADGCISRIVVTNGAGLSRNDDLLVQECGTGRLLAYTTSGRTGEVGQTKLRESDFRLRDQVTLEGLSSAELPLIRDMISAELNPGHTGSGDLVVLLPDRLAIFENSGTVSNDDPAVVRYSLSQELPLGPETQQKVFAADLDADMSPDILVLSSSPDGSNSLARIYRNTTLTGNSPRFTYSNTLALPHFGSDLKIAPIDVNNDKFTDLVAVGTGNEPSEVTLYLNTTPPPGFDQSGFAGIKFEQPLVLKHLTGSPKFVEVGDFNGDGRSDFAVGFGAAFNIDFGGIWLFINQLDRQFPLSAEQAFDAQVLPTSIDAFAGFSAEIDLDQRSDLLLFSHEAGEKEKVNFHYSFLNGSHEDSGLLGQEGISNPSAIQVADLNGDGIPEIVLPISPAFGGGIQVVPLRTNCRFHNQLHDGLQPFGLPFEAEDSSIAALLPLPSSADGSALYRWDSQGDSWEVNVLWDGKWEQDWNIHAGEGFILAYSGPVFDLSIFGHPTSRRYGYPNFWRPLDYGKEPSALITPLVTAPSPLGIRSRVIASNTLGELYSSEPKIQRDIRSGEIFTVGSADFPTGPRSVRAFPFDEQTGTFSGSYSIDSRSRGWTPESPAGLLGPVVGPGDVVWASVRSTEQN